MWFPRPMSENARGGRATDDERRVVLGRTRRERTRGRPAAMPLSEVFAPSSPPRSGLTLKSGRGLPTNCAIATVGRVEATGCLACASSARLARTLIGMVDKTAPASSNNDLALLTY